jgi:hypothetical protein
MRNRTCVWAVLFAVGAALGTTTTPALASDDTATGTWKWSFTRPNTDDKIEITLKLKQDGDKLTGTIAGPQGRETEIKDGSVKDGTVAFKVERERDGQTFSIQYSGKLEGDTIKGKTEFERNGEKRSRDWEAKREP